jgi:hypothetical protein
VQKLLGAVPRKSVPALNYWKIRWAKIWRPKTKTGWQFQIFNKICRYSNNAICLRKTVIVINPLSGSTLHLTSKIVWRMLDRVKYESCVHQGALMPLRGWSIYSYFNLKRLSTSKAEKSNTSAKGCWESLTNWWIFIALLGDNLNWNSCI